jgi:2-polyprenyl-3-methyl-5-hydroxy-6-metoxy-1,4-benzoquinol methylase
MLNQADIDYFNRGIIENPRFWSRFPGIYSFKNMRILDLGCGHGSMCIFLAKAGAKNVIGIDLDGERISFAKENLRC